MISQINVLVFVLGFYLFSPVIFVAYFVYDNVLFKIDKSIIVNPLETKVTATFQYWTIFTSAFDVAAIVDGRFDTQVQTEFFAEPPSGFPLAILDTFY